MLKRYGDQAALKESAARADELAVAGDQNGAVTRRRITDAVLQLANKTRPDRCTEFVVAPVAFAAPKWIGECADDHLEGAIVCPMQAPSSTPLATASAANAMKTLRRGADTLQTHRYMQCRGFRREWNSFRRIPRAPLSHPK